MRRYRDISTTSNCWFSKVARPRSPGGFTCGAVITALDGDQPEALRVLLEEAGVGESISVQDGHEEIFLHALLLNSHYGFRYFVHEASVVPRDDPEFRYRMAAACARGSFGIFQVLFDGGMPADAPLGERVLELHSPSGGTPRWTAMYFALASSEPGAQKTVGKRLGLGFSKPDEGSRQSGGVDGFREGVLRPESRAYHSGMPYSTRYTHW
ncbi:hypothetical protein PG997_000939 [Apiospora hydei]|uniref:Uncharacterized protein n=1 Tax=Apiospora hydei TaxID=1337664 RepID=A0ABR1XC63_9PEZI